MQLVSFLFLANKLNKQKKALILLLTNSAFGAVKYNCTHNEDKIGFTINHQKECINFHNVDYLAYSQILIDHDFKSDIKKSSLTFEYDWYYTASYQLNFSAPLVTHKHMRDVVMYLTFNDMDGSWEDDIQFECEITNLN